MQTINRNHLIIRISVCFHAGFLLLLLLWASVGNGIAEWQWQITTTPLKQTLSQKFPPRPHDAKAIQLQALTAHLEFGLTASPSPASLNSKQALSSPPSLQTNPPAPMDAATDKVMNSLGRDLFFRSEKGNVSPVIEALPTYLTKHQIDIEKITNLLTSGNSPRWARPSLDALLPPAQSPEQNLLIDLKRLRKLHRLLLLISLEHDRQEQSQLANKSLTAAWNLMNSLVDQPLGLSDSMLRDQAEVLRMVNVSSTEWRQRWATIRPLQSEQAPTAWTLINAEFLKESATCAIPSSLSCSEALRWGPPFRSLMKPYFKFAATDFVWKSQHIKTEDPCVLPPEAFAPASLEEKPLISWNMAYSIYLGRRWLATKNILLDWEVTDKILQIREQMARSQKPPAQISELEKSHVCSSLKWNYEVLADGNVRISSTDNRLSYTSDDHRFKPSDRPHSNRGRLN